MARESERSGNQSRAISKKNSTTTALAANTAFIGTKEEVVEYASLTCMVYCDAPSLPRGVKLQFSMDGSLWIDMTTYTLSAGEVKVFNLQVSAQFFRVVFVNDGQTQGVLQIQTIYHAYAQRDALNNITVVDGALMVNNIEADDSDDGVGDMGVIDVYTVGLLRDILKELRIMNLYNAEAMDFEIPHQDLGVR